MTGIIGGRESVLLTGGRSLRMGRDKARVAVGGVPLGEKIARELESQGWPTTVLGRAPIEGFRFQADRGEYAGPLAALREFEPEHGLVFVASCDLPRFDGRLPGMLEAALGGHDAVVPVLEGFDQPLCALYTAGSFERLRARPNLVRMKDWIALLDVRRCDEAALAHLGIDPLWAHGANTPAGLEALTGLSEQRHKDTG